MAANLDTIRLWDDNPTAEDMLGFGPVVQTVVAAVCSPTLDPVTVALQSSWGGGKSTALQLVREKLERVPDVVVVTCDPWEYDDLPKSEIRNLVISQVLSQLGNDRPGFAARATGILKRIGWAKVGTTVANTVLTGSVDVEKLVEAFTPVPDQPRSMAGFRAEFAELVAQTENLSKVVVLIDDLDRCSPDSVVAILEAVKVFLSVPKLAFVVAAEETLIRFAIERSANAGARSTYSDRYLEKIVQIPVRLPTLSHDDAETYIGLLLAQHRNPDASSALVAHVAQRREQGTKPYLGGDHPAGAAPHPSDLALAAQVAAGLSHDRWTSPRAIKRFLNAWGVRVAIAQARGANLDLDVMLKLYILEDRFPKPFEVLVQMAPETRADLLSRWEEWSRSDDDTVTRPGELDDDDTKTWAAASPPLSGIAGKIDAYLTVAATFTAVSAGEGLPSDVLALLDDLVSASPPDRRIAVRSIAEREVETRNAVIIRLLERAGAGPAEASIESAKEIALTDSSLHPVFHDALLAHALPHVVPASVVDIAVVPGARPTLEALIASSSVQDDVKSLAHDELANLANSVGER